MNRKWMILLVMSLIVALLVACGKGNDDGKSQKELDPVKLVIWTNQNEPAELYNELVQARYPHITLEMIKSPPGLADLVTGGQSPDMIIFSMLNFQLMEDMNLLYDLNPMIKQNNFDLSRIDPGLIKQVQSHAENGETYGIPHFVNFHALYYNKDIFDRFGVKYPTDNMTWDEVLDLAKDLSRTEDGVNYRGLDPENIRRLGNFLLGIPLLDPDTDEPRIEEWRPAFELLEKIISLPGNKPPVEDVKQWSNTPFIADRNVAMYLSTNQLSALQEAENLNWDMVSAPHYKEFPDVQGVPGGRALLITNTSKHKEDAFKVIETILSDDVQKELNRRGLVSTLIDKSVQAEFGKNLNYLEGKNVQAIFEQKAGWMPANKYEGTVANLPFNYSLELYKGTKDINTIIREMKAEMISAVQAAKTK